MKKNKFKFILFVLFVFSFVTLSWAAGESSSVEMNGDVVEYSMDGNVITAEGNVVIIHKEATLKADRIVFYRDRQFAEARGNVVLISGQGQISGEKLDFDFGTMKGDFNNARIMAAPFFGRGERVRRISDSKMIIENGYVSTSDFDDPEYRLTAKEIEVYPKEKLVARNIKMKLGKVPIMWAPKFTQNLNAKDPWLVLVPGYTKDWGMFLLSLWKYRLNDNIGGTFHLDAREKKDVAWGFDVDYNAEDFGKGVIKTYYMNERSITSNRFWQERPSPTIEKERFKIEWRHRWMPDDKTDIIWQYYKLSDSTFLKDYFENQYEEDSTPKTYFLLTRALPLGTFSFRTDARVNRFTSEVERLPELRYDLTSTELGNSNVYFKNTSTFVNLNKKTESPSEVRYKTKRFDIDNELSYPMKVAFIEITPYVGYQSTYYSRTNNPSKYNLLRNYFDTGATLSTKFFRIFDVHGEFLGNDINRLRHIITPSVDYKYAKDPTVPNSLLDDFDSIDDLERNHSMTYSIENKLQTKRDNRTVDLLRAIISTDFNLKEDTSKGGFDGIDVDIDLTPTDWLSLYFDSEYDTRKDHLTTANFDFYINGKDNRWSLAFGKRWDRDSDDQITAEFGWVINPKWKLRLYERMDLATGTQKEQEIALTRDLHSWIMDIVFNETKGEGDEIMLIFTLKAFPDMGVDFGTSFNKSKSGSQ